MEEFFENELVQKFERMIENNEEAYFDTDELEEIIIHYLEMGDIEMAEISVNFAYKIHPNSTNIKTKALEVLLELERYPEAKEIIEELRENSMNNTDFLVCCAKYYSNLGHTKNAIDYCFKALELGEEENFLHNFIADEMINMGDPFNALKHYQQALKADIYDDYALENIMSCFNRMNKSDEAIDFLNHYLDQYSYSETAWLEYGQYYFNKKNYKEALKGFEFLLAINNSSVGVYANIAACYEAMKKWKKAIEIYEESLEFEFTKSYTFYKIGLCYRALKQRAAALNAFQKSLREDPQFYLSMMEQSELYEEMGSMKEALHFAKEAALLNANNLDYQKKLAYLYIEAGKFEESLECLNKLIDAEPDRFYNWYAYIEVLMLIGEYEEAITILNSALKTHQRAELYYQLSNCYLHLKMTYEGTQALGEAMFLDATLLEDMKLKYPSIKDEIKKIKTGK
ncbi:MAG: tetratricopeptide repeat protein [Bacteroidetes bacterium]|nr:tetratricopeptide repeat protein [Bacteroidota bacterium]